MNPRFFQYGYFNIYFNCLSTRKISKILDKENKDATRKIHGKCASLLTEEEDPEEEKEDIRNKITTLKDQII